MNITPQPFAQINISLHKTDDPGHANYIKVTHDGQFDHCVIGLVLAMASDSGFALMVELAMESFQDPKTKTALSDNPITVNPRPDSP